MARRPRPASRYSEEALAEFSDFLNALVLETDLSARIICVQKVTVKSADGVYRKKPLVDQELVFNKTRAGKRGEIIFEFEPADTQPFIAAEFSEKEIATQLDPDFASAFNDCLWQTMIRLRDVETTHDPDLGARTELANQMGLTAPVLDDCIAALKAGGLVGFKAAFVGHREARAATIQAQQEQVKNSAYSTNASWGTW